LSGLEAAREEAVLSARSLVLEELRAGNPISVSDEMGQVLLTILFTEVALNVGNVSPATTVSIRAPLFFCARGRSKSG
jgi:hypothetical protein